jgi:hypothetical protein
MSGQKTVQVDVETLRVLGSLITAAKICLDGMTSRHEKELSVIGLAKSLTERAEETLERLLRNARETSANAVEEAGKFRRSGDTGLP